MANKVFTKPVLMGKSTDTINHPTGVLEKQITGEDLIKNPEVHIRMHRSHYRNAAQLEHELNTQGVVRKTMGKKEVFRRAKGVNGNTMNILTGRKK